MDRASYKHLYKRLVEQKIIKHIDGFYEIEKTPYKLIQYIMDSLATIKKNDDEYYYILKNSNLYSGSIDDHKISKYPWKPNYICQWNIDNDEPEDWETRYFRTGCYSFNSHICYEIYNELISYCNEMNEKLKKNDSLYKFSGITFDAPSFKSGELKGYSFIIHFSYPNKKKEYKTIFASFSPKFIDDFTDKGEVELFFLIRRRKNFYFTKSFPMKIGCCCSKHLKNSNCYLENLKKNISDHYNKVIKHSNKVKIYKKKEINDAAYDEKEHDDKKHDYKQYEHIVKYRKYPIRCEYSRW